MKCLAALPLVFVPLLWVPLPCSLTALCSQAVLATDPNPVAADGEAALELPTGFSVEYPRDPLLLGSPFELVVRGPDLQSLHLGVEDHLGDVIVGRVTRSEVTADGSEGRLEPQDGAPAGTTVELRRPVSIAREGDYSLPLAVVDTSGKTTDLPPLELSVLLDVPDGHRTQVSDLLAPVVVPVPPASAWPFIGASLIALGLLGWLVVSAGREKPVYVYEPPADRVALDALADLRQHLPRTTEEIRPFLIRVSDVLRVYIESAFQLHAPALTTEEFLDQAAHRHDALGERREALASFLQRCDLVKYAGDRPAPAAAEPLLVTVETFVEETRDVVGAPPVADAVTGVLSPADTERLRERERDEQAEPTTGGPA